MNDGMVDQGIYDAVYPRAEPSNVFNPHCEKTTGRIQS